MTRAFLNKHKFKLALFFLGLLYFVTRIINLGLIPIFTDEAIYLRWSQIMANDAALRYLPLVDGKPPLFMWVISVAMRMLPFVDVLIVGRFVSVMSGFLAMCGIFACSYALFKNKIVSTLSVLFYLLTPFTLFYDRFALADSMLAMWGLWSLFFTILLVKYRRLDLAFILGFINGFGLLTKSPALLFLAYFPLLLLFFPWKSREWKKEFIKLVILFGVMLIVTESIYSILRLFPLFHMISQKNMEFSLSLNEFIKNPTVLFWGNVKSLIEWEASYIGLPTFILIFLAVFIGGIKYFKEHIILLLYFLILLLYLSFFNKILYPRYLLLFTPQLLIMSASGLYLLSTKSIRIGYLYGVATMVFLTFICIQILFTPGKAYIPKADTGQYLNSWSAGNGVKEIRNFLSQESKAHKHVTLGVEGTFGLMPYALELYQKDYPNVNIIPYWPLPGEIPKDISMASKIMPTYFIIYQREDYPKEWQMKELSRYFQGNSKESLKLYKVL